MRLKEKRLYVYDENDSVFTVKRKQGLALKTYKTQSFESFLSLKYDLNSLKLNIKKTKEALSDLDTQSKKSKANEISKWDSDTSLHSKKVKNKGKSASVCLTFFRSICPV